MGGNLLGQARFEDTYNSSNVEAIEGRHYELIVCAGAPGAKWKANQDPEGDLASLDRLMTSLARASADHVVLISTVDVYPAPVGVDEETPIAEAESSPYGRHRLRLERFVRSRFSSTVVRLPGLFGSGLKKNVIYDFLNQNRLDAIHPESRYQFYPLARLWRDIELVRTERPPAGEFRDRADFRRLHRPGSVRARLREFRSIGARPIRHADPICGGLRSGRERTFAVRRKCFGNFAITCER